MCNINRNEKMEKFYAQLVEKTANNSIGIREMKSIMRYEYKLFKKRSELSFMETVHMFVDMFENNEHKLSGSRKVTSHFEKLSDAHYMRSSNNISHILKVDYVRGVIKYLQLGDDGRYYKQQNSIENFIVESYAKMQILANSYETAFMAGLKLYTKSYEKDRKYWVENYSKTAFFRSTKKDTKTNQTPTLAELLSLADEYTRHLIKCTFKLSTFKNTNHIGWVSSFRKMFHLMISEKWGKVKTTLTILDIFGIPHDQTFATHDYICIFPGEERNIPEPYVYGHGLWTAEIKGHEYINKLPKIFRMMAHETEWAIPEFQSVMDDIFEEYGRQIEQELYEAFDRNKRISKQKSLIRAETRKKENEINKEYSSTATCFQLLKKIKEQTDNKLAISLARATLLVALRDKGIFSIVTRDFQTLNTTPTTEQITKALKQSFGLALTKYSVSEIVFAIPSKEHCPYSNPYIPKNDNGVTANIAFDVDTPDGQRIKMNKMSKLIANAYSCNTYTPYIKSLEKIVLYYAGEMQARYTAMRNVIAGKNCKLLFGNSYDNFLYIYCAWRIFHQLEHNFMSCMDYTPLDWNKILQFGRGETESIEYPARKSEDTHAADFYFYKCNGKAHAAALIGEDGSCVARCNVWELDNGKWYADRAYSKNDEASLTLYSMLQKEGKADYFKCIGADCHQITYVTDTPGGERKVGLDVESWTVSIDMLEEGDPIAYMDTFKRYDGDETISMHCGDIALETTSATLSYLHCESCGRSLHDCDYMEINNALYCEDCVDEYFTQCEHCRCYISNDDIFNIGDHYSCDCCLNEHYTMCAWCETYHPNNELVDVKSNGCYDPCCQDCMDEPRNEIWQCDECGEYFDKSYTPFIEEETGRALCKDCQ